MPEELACRACSLEKDIALLHRQKAELRAFARVILTQTSHSAFLLRSENMRNILCASPVWNTSRSILAFAPTISEPNLLPADFRERDIFCLKRLNSHYKPVAIYSRRDLKLGPLGILEPNSKRTFPLGKIDLILVPGLAFDLRGGRLGRGGGHYDRILSRPDCVGKVIGVCYAAQVVEYVPRERHDLPVGALLTEKGLVEITSPLNPQTF
ncbi:5-formyltetrahydrofolate cyclo-ligase family protein [Candidatus Xiphinematobacter sp. Idaho Grape]|uniref:5-formyltetrahydrofolate cyclo-ligase n=1 Tax=Candidatus Xiphinematobacter sp. Idaho Grape TaxID=1704307 RepID=UPI000705E9B6|nr:5-formyltetrahydrofolate cyclo-ligase [Candidatus Xiphinematobacter sp. Idaho Grape]ALJ56602.1 5-formyltetrahydrofolate cyclo-ligase family protein [Candidatus Xiphinematobacter sp. Idaho Grape]